MLFELIFHGLIGLLCLSLGWIIWRKQKVSLVHEYHHIHVKKEDVAAYTRLIGTGLMVFGAGCCLTGLINALTRTHWGWLAFAAAFLSGVIIFHRAQKTYNGSWF